MPKEKSFKFPKTLGSCVDLLYATRALRFKAQHAADEIGTKETALENHIFNSFKKTDLEGARGKAASVSIIRKDVANFTDFDEFMAYVTKKKAYDLVQRRASNKACAERWDQGVVIPGVEKFTKMSLSLTKAPARKK